MFRLQTVVCRPAVLGVRGYRVPPALSPRTFTFHFRFYPPRYQAVWGRGTTLSFFILLIFLFIIIIFIHLIQLHIQETSQWSDSQFIFQFSVISSICLFINLFSLLFTYMPFIVFFCNFIQYFFQPSVHKSFTRIIYLFICQSIYIFHFSISPQEHHRFLNRGHLGMTHLLSFV